MDIIQSYLTNNPCYKANAEQADSRYAVFQARGPQGLMLHSVGCAQPSARVFVNKWNRADYADACVHAFIDADSGAVWQTLPWNYRAWHCGGSGNNTHIGVELCESRHIRYTGHLAEFEILDRAKAQADARRSYAAAVELFAALCVKYKLDPLKAICSHREGGKSGIASGHVDPEHYWSGLGLDYSMAGFRRDVAAAMKAGSPQLPEAAAAPAPAPETPAPAAPTPASPAPAESQNSPAQVLPFSDVEPGAWYADALVWALEQGVIQASKGPFYPEAPLTKAMAVVLLRRLYRAAKR